MKKLYSVIFVLLFTITAFADSIYFTPAIYYTGGDYSKNSSSHSYAGYFSLGSLRHGLLFSYENLSIDNYRQDYFNIGGTTGFSNFYLKLNYGHASGSESRGSGRQNISSDINNLYSTDVFYTDYRTYIGAGFSYQKQEGYVLRDVSQFMLRIEHIPHWRVLLSLKPVFTNVSDGRELFGVNGRINYLPFDKFLIKIHGFYGERAYFFDPDLLILFNQDETQEYLASVQLEYYFTYRFNLAAGFQHTSFGSYKINYYILGVRTNLIF